MDYDVLVIGSGIGGMESSIKLADMGYKVLLVEKEASVGGRMILLSKVFPTLDCASCISGPKMSSTINHPNITTKTYSEVMGVKRESNGAFRATVKEKSTFVDWAACTGCNECQTACTVAVPDEFNSDLVARRAAYIAFPQAVPKKAVITRAGTTTPGEISESLKRLHQAGLATKGVLFNDLETRPGRYGYGYTYGRYHHTQHRLDPPLIEASAA